MIAIIQYEREHRTNFRGCYLFPSDGQAGEALDPRQKLGNWLGTIKRSIASIAGAAVRIPRSSQGQQQHSSGAELLALGERLKALVAKRNVLEPKVSAAYQAAWDDGRKRTQKMQNAADKRFREVAKQNGYSRLADQRNALDDEMHEVARAILKIGYTDRIGDGIRAVAAMVLSDDLDDYFSRSPSVYETTEVLWEMASRANFPAPAWVTKKLKRRTLARTDLASA